MDRGWVASGLFVQHMGSKKGRYSHLVQFVGLGAEPLSALRYQCSRWVLTDGEVGSIICWCADTEAIEYASGGYSEFMSATDGKFAPRFAVMVMGTRFGNT